MTENPSAAPGCLARVAGTVYGLHLQGSLPAGCRAYLWSGDASARESDPLEVTYRAVPTVARTESVWTTPPEEASPWRYILSGRRDDFVLTVGGADRGSFRCTPRRIAVAWASAAAAVAHQLFAYALPLWLEARGVPLLHGSAVTLDRRAVGFLGPGGCGKSVLCAELVRLGCGFLSDDGLAPQRGAGDRWHCPPGPPLLRLWPGGLAERLGWAEESLPSVHGGSDKRRLPVERLSSRRPPRRGHPLAALYLLDRRDGRRGAVEISGVGPREALVRLLEHGIAAAPAAALGLAAERLDRLAALAAGVPVRRLAYPSGTDSAPEVVAAIRRDLEP